MAPQRNEHASKLAELTAERSAAADQIAKLTDENRRLKQRRDEAARPPQEDAEGDWEAMAMLALDESAAVASQLARTLHLLDRAEDRLLSHQSCLLYTSPSPRDS
eukprot:TRINITY_DN53827_c0_g1_i1.p1 TRINITY_DN53827_c0_g1~~TRINITY_DN53827_c0_g1_i1.p1  ORF type:complete len:105 (-),score=29.56 TRINITY_DN53827_c0_g1_i1:50-364(-)